MEQECSVPPMTRDGIPLTGRIQSGLLDIGGLCQGQKAVNLYITFKCVEEVSRTKGSKHNRVCQRKDGPVYYNVDEGVN